MCSLHAFTALFHGLLSASQDVLQTLSFTAAGQLNPLAAMFGGVVGQEVMKAASGKFHPLFQFFYFDSIESLPEEALSPEDVAPLVCCRPACCLLSALSYMLHYTLNDAQALLRNLSCILTDGSIEDLLGPAEIAPTVILVPANVAMVRDAVASTLICATQCISVAPNQQMTVVMTGLIACVSPS